MNTLARGLVTGLMSLLLLGACASAGLDDRPLTDDKGSRSLGTLYNDQLVESTATDAIRRSSVLLESAPVSVTSVNGIVLLTGQVPSADTKTLAGAKAQLVSNVRRVHNELTVGPPADLARKASDTLLTTKIKARMVGERNFPVRRVKVLTEGGVVYLLGLVTQAEANWSVNIARKASGVQKIVKVFEYID